MEEKKRAFEVGFSLGLFSLQKFKLPIVINFFLSQFARYTNSLAHTYLGISLSSGLKEKLMLSTLLYCKDNKGLHCTAGKVRSNVSIGINGKSEPRTQSTGKSFLDTGYSISVFHKTRLAPPSLHFEGTSGTLKCRNNLRQPIVSGNPSSLVTPFQYWQCRQPRGEDAGAESGC